MCPRPQGEIIESMPVAIGICCGKCGRVYLVTHRDNARRIQYDESDPVRPSYKLACQCSAVRFFDKREMLPYSISAYSVRRGYANRGDYLQISRLESPKQSAGGLVTRIAPLNPLRLGRVNGKAVEAYPDFTSNPPIREK